MTTPYMTGEVMTEAEKKALAMVNEVRAADGRPPVSLENPHTAYAWAALIRSIEQHDAFRQDVSAAVEQVLNNMALSGDEIKVISPYLSPFILPKPVDPLTECFVEAFKGSRVGELDGYWTIEAKLRAALADRGLKIAQEN